MKLRTLIAWTCALVPIASLAQNTPLKVVVQGEIKPGACTVQIANQAAFNYGKVKVKDLKWDTYTLLPVIDRELHISCEAKTKVALTISDTNAGLVPFTEDIVFFGGHGKSWSPARQYGLRNDAGRAIGSWALRLVPGFTVDQAATDSIFSGDNGKTWEPSVGNFFHDDGSLETWSVPGQKEPVLGYEFVGTMRTQVALDRTGQLGVVTEVPFTGGAVLTLVYL
ncbi:hypothetical protein BWP39_09790 [Paraburkholderia acidicola]|uniref:DUF1120 domain-containing protein n=1 Tax=Paraburkholderia acidicola TaxID=1912599 RepID=A0A2A4F354_9BURK|nr:DUF1120 domain-containing protein [Paraburkholderia acidicola]PCE27068.1 hypothetical protein BWP39_09790 [Paraburkholderia acidicola]